MGETDNTSHVYVYLVLSSLTMSDYDIDVMLIEKSEGEDILNSFWKGTENKKVAMIEGTDVIMLIYPHLKENP